MFVSAVWLPWKRLSGRLHSVGSVLLLESRIQFSTNTAARMNEVQATDRPSTRIGWRAGYLLAAFGIYMADQASKAWAARMLRSGDDRTIISGFFDLVYTENRGIAFGQLQEGGSFGRWFFVILAIAAAVAVLYYFLRTLTQRRSDPGRVRASARRHYG